MVQSIFVKIFITNDIIFKLASECFWVYTYTEMKLLSINTNLNAIFNHHHHMI